MSVRLEIQLRCQNESYATNTSKLVCPQFVNAIKLDKFLGAVITAAVSLVDNSQHFWCTRKIVDTQPMFIPMKVMVKE